MGNIGFNNPDNWTFVRLNDICASIQYGLGYSAKNEGTNKYLRITDIQNNSVNWDTVPFVDIADSEDEYCLKNKDIVFARSGATVGKSFLIENPPEKSVFASYLIRIQLIVPDLAGYLIHFFNSSYYWKQIMDKSTGSGQPNCNGTKLSQLIVPLPPFHEAKQIEKKINEVLPFINAIQLEKGSLAKYVEKAKAKILEKIFSEDSSYKSYYRNKYKLGEILLYEQPGPYIVSSTNYSDAYSTPVLTPGKSFILGYTDDTDGVYRTDGNKVIIFDDFTTESRLIDFDFKVKSSAMKILHISSNDLFSPDYMYYLLQTINVDNENHKRYWISEYSNLEIKVHDYKTQIQIVKDIDHYFQLLESLSI